MPQIIPFIPGQNNYRLRTSFDNEEVLFRVRWNAHDSAHYIDVLEPGEEPIAQGIKVVLGVNLGRRSTHPFFLRNLLHAFDTTLQGVEAGVDDLGGRVVVVRYGLAELVPTIDEDT